MSIEYYILVLRYNTAGIIYIVLTLHCTQRLHEAGARHDDAHGSGACGRLHRRDRQDPQGRAVLGLRHGRVAAAIAVLFLVQRSAIRQQRRRRRHGTAGQRVSYVEIRAIVRCNLVSFKWTLRLFTMW